MVKARIPAFTAVSLHECRVSWSMSLAVTSQVVMVGKATSAAVQNRSCYHKPISHSIESDSHLRRGKYPSLTTSDQSAAPFKPRPRRLLYARLEHRAEGWCSESPLDSLRQYKFAYRPILIVKPCLGLLIRLGCSLSWI